MQARYKDLPPHTKRMIRKAGYFDSKRGSNFKAVNAEYTIQEWMNLLNKAGRGWIGW